MSQLALSDSIEYLELPIYKFGLLVGEWNFFVLKKYPALKGLTAAALLVFTKLANNLTL